MVNSEKTAGVIIIGNEILSGRTQDSNLSYLGKRLDALGVQLTEAIVIPDQEIIIIDTVRNFHERFDYIFTTGGIGPTHDDITSQSIAKAFNVKLEQNPDAVAKLEQYYEPGRINAARLKMANIPRGGILIDNPVSGAPGFQIENVFVLAGVPIIMEAMFEGIIDRIKGGAPILTASVATNIGESILASGLTELQDKYPDITIGSYPFFKRGKLGVNLVFRSTSSGKLIELNNDIKHLISGLDGKIVEEHMPS